MQTRVEAERERLAELGQVKTLRQIKEAMLQMERESILKTLRLCHWERRETAMRLGISEAKLYRRLAKYRAEGHL